MELTDKIVKEKNLTTIMVTHNLRYAIEYGNRLVMMHQGNAILDKKGCYTEYASKKHSFKGCAFFCGCRI